jgi:peroxiredoxin
MGAWARTEDRRQRHDAGRRQRRLHQAVRLELDLTKGGLGIRSQRYSMWSRIVVKALYQPGQFEVSSADAM